MSYTLAQDNGDLTLTIADADRLPPELTFSGNALEWTNKDVVLTAYANETVTFEYSFDGVEWFEGSEVTVTENKTVLFKATDLNGNVTSETVVVDKIDKTAPILEVSGNTLEWTNQDVILTASSNEGTIEYFNGTEWVEGNTITAAINGTYQFRAADAAGNVTVQSIEVSKIDKAAPILEVSGNAVDWTAQNVILTVSADEAAVIEYSFDGKKWFTGTEVTVTENTNVYFRATDHVGNVTTQSVVVDKIDKAAPFLEISGNAVEWTNQDVVLNVQADEYVTVKYSFDGREWFAGAAVAVQENTGIYFIAADRAGNFAVQFISVDKIDILQYST